jgi:hypothetical protein
MLPLRRTRQAIRQLAPHRAAILCIAALGMLLARSAPPVLSHYSITLTSKSHVNHDHRQCFDHEDLQWSVSPTLALAPQLAASPLSTSTVRRFFDLRTNGWHDNRPPPTS